MRICGVNSVDHISLSLILDKEDGWKAEKETEDLRSKRLGSEGAVHYSSMQIQIYLEGKGLSEKLFIKPAFPCCICKVPFIYSDTKRFWQTKPLTALCLQK
jgi:hypothetical protein